ncbi:GCN5-related N-acetyltransferase [hydrothermal vent metagenome]|uniref:GCN5-related N-acetyltransferase n=1 Tax=hydrothermal vent metagenome TaxID=652676 RepID=A0A3B0TG82_9ZZZZ
MTSPAFFIRPEAEDDHIEPLLDDAFGPGRYTRTAYRLREGVAEVSELAFVAQSGGKIVGSLKYWPVRIGSGHRALLLGPLAVHRDWRGKGCGLALMQHTLPLAAQMDHRLVILVGDLPYYGRAGFTQVPTGTIQLSGPVDPVRLLWLELVSGASRDVGGLIGS